MKTPKKVTKRQMWKLGCAGTVFSTLNHEFGFPILAEEKATANFGGGLNQSGRQCGLLWGSSMAAGAEAHRQSKDPDEALGKAILTTKQLINSYSSKTGSPNCREVTGCNPSTPLGLTKYMLLAKPLACMKLAGDWVSEAYEVIRGGISEEPTIPGGCKSCASEVAKKMGANEEEVAMVAGFAGGLGLSGNACGALAAAIWMKTLPRTRNGQSIFSTSEAKTTFRALKAETGGELLCQKITGRKFNSLEEHTQFINEGGCSRLIDLLAKS